MLSGIIMRNELLEFCRVMNVSLRSQASKKQYMFLFSINQLISSSSPLFYPEDRKFNLSNSWAYLLSQGLGLHSVRFFRGGSPSHMSYVTKWALHVYGCLWLCACDPERHSSLGPCLHQAKGFTTIELSPSSLPNSE